MVRHLFISILLLVSLFAYGAWRTQSSFRSVGFELPAEVARRPATLDSHKSVFDRAKVFFMTYANDKVSFDENDALLLVRDLKEIAENSASAVEERSLAYRLLSGVYGKLAQKSQGSMSAPMYGRRSLDAIERALKLIPTSKVGAKAYASIVKGLVDAVNRVPGNEKWIEVGMWISLQSKCRSAMDALIEAGEKNDPAYTVLGTFLAQ